MATTDGFTLRDVLGYVYLTKMLQEIKTGIPNRLPDEMYAESVTEDVPADEARYVVVEGTRQTARRLDYSSPARQRQLRPIGRRDVQLWHSREFQNYPASKYMTLRAFQGYEIQPMGAAEIERQTTEFAAVFDNAEVATSTYPLGNDGKLYWDRDGNLAVTSQSSSGGVDIDFDIPANNKSQLNGIINTSWATTNTADINTDIRQIRQRSLQDTGYPIDCCFYGINIPSYIFENDILKEYLKFNPGFNEYLKTTNEIPDGFLNIKKWVPVYESFFEDSGGTNRTFFGADTVAFTPAVDVTWWQRFRGGYMLPTTFQPFQSNYQFTGGGKVVHGKFGYGKMMDNPTSLEVHMGHTFLAVIKNPKAVYIADVTP